MNAPPPPNPTWPPIISSARVPLWVRIRDMLLAIGGWLIVQDLLLDFWILMYDWLKDPIFELAPEDAPDWDAILMKLDPFLMASGALVCLILIVAWWRRRFIVRSLKPASPPVPVVANEGGDTAAALTAIQRLRCADVHIDQAGAIERVESRSGWA